MIISKNSLTKEQRRLIKSQRRIEKDHNSFLKRNQDPLPLRVVCVRFGSKYGRDYVEKLRNMVARHLTVPYSFYCLTDDKHEIPGVISLIQNNGGYSKAWWHKIHMFDPSLPLHGRILYFDLDIVIYNNINKLTEVGEFDFYGICDFNRKFYPKWNSLNSSVMTWIHGTQNEIYDEFCKNKMAAQRMHGDQDWIWRISKNKIKFFPYEWIQSYKWEIRGREELVDRTGKKGFRETKNHINLHPESAVAVFHGDPKPSMIKDRLIVDNWQ